jgi:diguanylate cyclase (GGDEF)-like protein
MRSGKQPFFTNLNGHSIGKMKRVTSEGIVQRCWFVLLSVLGVTAFIQMRSVESWRLVGTLLLFLALLGANVLGARLRRDEVPLASLWYLAMVSATLMALVGLLRTNPFNGALWLLFPLCAVTSVIFFPPRIAYVHTAMFTALFVFSNLLVTVGHFIWQIALGRSVFILVLAYLVERSCQRETQLVEEITARTAETDAFTTISWSLTTLMPDTDAVAAILARACPPEVSLGLVLWDQTTNKLTTQAAVGKDADALQRWHYQMRPESTSMVAVALRERRAIAASTANESAALIFAGSLPEPNQPLRSVAVLPVMCQGAAPFGALLAISSRTEAASNLKRLGILPAVANQFAVSLENALLYHEAQDRADHDAMTGLYHHRAILNRLTEEIVRANRSATPFAVMMIDLDRFKLYNETYGHQVGDRIILQAANSLRRSLRSSDILGRYGGDEFLALLPDTDPAEALLAAQTLVETIAAEEFRPQESAERMPLTLSVGVAMFPNDGSTALDLIARSEEALQDAKHNGGNRQELAERPESDVPNGRAVDLRGFGILESLVTAVDHKDRYTKFHSEEVATYAQLLAEALDLPPQRCALFFDAGLLHDVGKVGVPDAVLRKPGRLSKEEFDAMKQHVVLSEALVRYLLPADTDPDVIDAVRYHHERWDGKGYPYGLAGEDVPLAGRILIVADATSAMHMDRPYRKGLTPTQIVGELRRGAGTQFDPALVEPFVKVFLAFYHLTEADLVSEPAAHQSSAA